MTDLATRYGGPSRSMRVIALLVVAGLALGGLGFVGWAAFSTSTPEVQSRLTSFSFPDEHHAVARLTVVRDDESTVATCALTALAEDHAIVGVKQVVVDSGPTQQVLTIEIETERPATAVDSPGCTTADQPRPR